MNIYKVHVLNLDNTTKIIYVFSGEFYKYTQDIEDLNKLFNFKHLDIRQKHAVLI